MTCKKDAPFNHRNAACLSFYVALMVIAEFNIYIVILFSPTTILQTRKWEDRNKHSYSYISELQSASQLSWTGRWLPRLSTTAPRYAFLRLSESCVIFVIFHTQVCSMASCSCREWRRCCSGGTQAPSSELLVQMGSQARSKLEKEREIIISQRQQPMHDVDRIHGSSFPLQHQRISRNLDFQWPAPEKLVKDI